MLEWFYGALILVAVVLNVITRNMAYKHGIWDGAFNQSLPHVRRAMLEYKPDHKFPADLPDAE